MKPHFSDEGGPAQFRTRVSGAPAALVCAALTVWYSLRSFNPFTPLGSIPVSGHVFVQEPAYTVDGRSYEPLRCQRCGVRSVAWR